MNWTEKLKAPIQSKWRVQSFSKTKPMAICIPYIDARDAMNRLDDVVGAGNWQTDYKQIKDVVYCGIGINIFHNDIEKEPRWVWKWDAGTESQVEKQKGEASDSFKRAFVKWGGARDLYDSDMQYVKANAKKESNNYPYCVDESGKKIYNLTEYINNKLGKLSRLPQWYDEAVKYLSTGGTIDTIKAKYKVSKELETKLMEDAI